MNYIFGDPSLSAPPPPIENLKVEKFKNVYTCACYLGSLSLIHPHFPLKNFKIDESF